MGQNDKEQLAKVLEPPLAGLGFELVDVVVSRYRANVAIRVFVYGEQGVSVGDCARLSRVIGEVIEGTEMFPDGYTLEVSSPGLDRPLATARDFRRRVGETVRVSFVDSGRKQITAEILGVTDEVVEFSGDTGPVRIPVAEISQAKIVF
jgi:ribosome maturation factor RimP